MNDAERVRVPFVPSAAQIARRRLRTFLGDRHLGQRVVDDALVVVSELVSNAVRHGAPQPDGELSVSWTVDDDLLLLQVADGGSTHDPSEVGAPPDADGGRGLSIVSKLTRRWWVDRGDDGLRVSAVLDLG